MYRQNSTKFDLFFNAAVRNPGAYLLVAMLLVGCGGKSDNDGKSGTDSAYQPPVPAIHTEILNPDVYASVSHILVAWAGAENAPAEITRTKAEARSRASQIAYEASSSGADFIELVHKYSDEENAETTDGYLGIIERGVMDIDFEIVVFAMPVGSISSNAETAWGYHVIKREVIQQAHLRHILISWEGARRHSAAVDRTHSDAAALAAKIYALATEADADFCRLARRFSDDTASRGNCGDLGIVYRSSLDPLIEAAGFRLRAGSVGEPVETDFGYHIIRRDKMGIQPGS